MFSSTNNVIVNPFPHFPSSSSSSPSPYHPPPLLVLSSQDSNDNNSIFHLHHHHHLDELPPTSSLWPPSDSLVNIAAVLNNELLDGGGGGGVHGECFGAAPPCAAKKPAKKDRHRKIRTAQGVRDRRVRLSIEIAREFFDLQDMLGFDKASKTLEWLLNKSQYAIKDLGKKHQQQLKDNIINQYSSPHHDPYNCEVGEVDGGEWDEEGAAFNTNNYSNNNNNSFVSNSKEKDIKKLNILAKESRAKARARARERTREKMCTRSSTCTMTTCPNTNSNAISHPQFLNQLTSLTQASNNNMASTCFTVNVAHQIEQPKPSTNLGSHHHHHNISASNDVNVSCSSGTGNNYFPNLPQNWEINGAISH